MLFTDHAVKRFNRRVAPVQGPLEACRRANLLIHEASTKGLVSRDNPGKWFRTNHRKMRARIVFISALREVMSHGIRCLEEIVFVVDTMGSNRVAGWTVITVVAEHAEDVHW